MSVNRVVLYARVSKVNGHQNPEVQLSALRAHCAARGWTVVQEFVDHGVSGAKRNRPALDKMMSAACTGTLDFDAVMVWKIDRFGRSVQHLCNAVKELADHSIVFISMTDNLDMSTPAGRFMFHMLSAVAEFERELIRERVKNGLRDAALKGRYPGRKISAAGPSRCTLWRRARAAQAVGRSS